MRVSWDLLRDLNEPTFSHPDTGLPSCSLSALVRLFGVRNVGHWHGFVSAMQLHSPDRAVFYVEPGRFLKKVNPTFGTWCITLEAFPDALVNVFPRKGKKAIEVFKKRHTSNNGPECRR